MICTTQIQSLFLSKVLVSLVRRIRPVRGLLRLPDPAGGILDPELLDWQPRYGA